MEIGNKNNQTFVSNFLLLNLFIMKKNVQITVQQLEKMSDVQLASINLDDVNFVAYNKEVQNRGKLAILKQSNKGMFKYDTNMSNKDKKQLRTNSRKIRNTFFTNINRMFTETTSTNLKKECENFIKFYKATYLLNDFSLDSLVRPNSDKNTIAVAKSSLHILKLYVSGKIK